MGRKGAGVNTWRGSLVGPARYDGFPVNLHSYGWEMVSMGNQMEQEGQHRETANRFPRKITAVMSVDVQGYSRLMGRDETRTVKTLKAYRQILRSIITDLHGRVIDSPGDNLLADFGSVVDAVTAALAIQDEIGRRNALLPEDRRMPLRIGVNLGDVIVDGQRIYGDGVNIAARIEALAPGGGVCISGTAYDQVQSKIRFGCTYLGSQSVKNIAHPVRVYEIWKDPDASVCRVRFWPRTASSVSRNLAWLGTALAGIAVFALILGVIITPRLPTRNGTVEGPLVTAPTDRPTIAVLPFSSLSADGQKAYLADGITNDIITDLSRFRDLAVTASTSVYQFKGKVVDVIQVGRQLKVAFILEGSIQADNNRIRINAQLIETVNGKHIWADRYDSQHTDLLSLQNAIIETIVRKLALNLSRIEREHALSKKTDNLSAYDNYLRGYHNLYQRTRTGMKIAKQHFKQAIDLDPEFSAAHIGLASVRILDAAYGYTEFPNVAMQEAETLLQKALVFDEFNAQARAKLGYVYMRRGAYDLAKNEAKRSLDLNPNEWNNYRVLAPIMLYSGDPEQALRWYHMALTYDPYVTPGWYMNMGICYYLLDQYDEAVRWLVQAVDKWPSFLGSHIVLASIYAHTNQPMKAAKEVDRILRIAPFFDLQFYGQAFRKAEHRQRILNGLRKAGLS